MTARKKQMNKKDTIDSKLNLMREVMVNQQKKKVEKLKNFYDSMKKVQVERKG